MHLLEISTTQFRNLAAGTAGFSPEVNIFVGPNGHGKTNMLEAIYFFKFGRSFRASRDIDLIRFGENYFRIVVVGVRDSGDREEYAGAVDEQGVKQITVNGAGIGRLSELVGTYPCVLFGPQDLKIINGFPQERRRFVDMAGSMADRGYLENVREYNRTLLQRNAALKAGCSREELAAWNEELVAKGCLLVRNRESTIGELTRFAGEFAAAVFETAAVEIRYACTMEQSDGLEEQFAEQLAAAEPEERKRRTTLVGPHRDDLLLTLGGTDVKRFGSQGQKRLCAVLLRLAEMRYIEERLNERCMLLLDDLFSELDADNSARLMAVLRDRNQIFVTSPVSVNWEHAGETRTFRLSSGAVIV